MDLSALPAFLLKTVNDVPPEAWTIIIETVAAALIASPLVVGLKKWLHLHSEKVMVVVTILASMGTAVGAYFINDPAFSAWWLPIHGWLIFATSQPVYYFLIKPIIRRVQTVIAEAIAFNNEVKSAAVPPTGLPNSTDQQ